jgi:hypothetical protein
MKTWQIAVAGTLFLILAGCRADPTVALLERQNRMLEDEVYRLRSMMEDCDAGMARGCSGAEIIEAGPGGAEPNGPAPEERPLQRGRRSPSRQTVAPPTVELPSQAQPANELPDVLKRPAGTPAPGKPGTLDAPQAPQQWQEPSGSSAPRPLGQERLSPKKSSLPGAGGYQSSAKGDSKHVGQIVLNRMLSGGLSEDNKPGDSGVLVVLEPRDAKGRRLEAPGDVSVVLLDPAKSGDEARFARWDFPASETARLFRGNGVARGMYIECPWPDGPPEHNRMHLFVRYTTSDGRKLQVDEPIEISLPGERASRWTPSEGMAADTAGSDAPLYRSGEEGGYGDAAQAGQQPEVGRGTRSSVADRRTTVRGRSAGTASQTDSGRLERPVWSPDRF